MSGRPTMLWVVAAGAVVMAILHQDLWNWHNRRLVLDFMPVGLAYHALFSLAATVLWGVASRFVWPHHIEQWAGEPIEAQEPHQ